MGTTVAPTPSPKRVEVGGGGWGKRKKTHAEYLREAAEALLAMEPGTPQYRAARAKLKAAVKAEKATIAAEEDLILVLFVLDLL